MRTVLNDPQLHLTHVQALLNRVKIDNGDDPMEMPPLNCPNCGQRNTAWSSECGRCELPFYTAPEQLPEAYLQAIEKRRGIRPPVPDGVIPDPPASLSPEDGRAPENQGTVVAGESAAPPNFTFCPHCGERL